MSPALLSLHAQTTENTDRDGHVLTHKITNVCLLFGVYPNEQTHKQINTAHHIEMPIRWGKYYAIPRYYSTIYIFQVLDP